VAVAFLQFQVDAVLMVSAFVQSSPDSGRHSGAGRRPVASWLGRRRVARVSRPMGEGFALLPESELLLLCLPKEEVTKKGHPARRLAVASATSGCVEGWPGFSTGHPALIEKARTSLSPPACGGLIAQPSPPRREPGKSKSSHVERCGCFFSPQYITSPSPLRGEGGMRGGCSRRRFFVRAVRGRPFGKPSISRSARPLTPTLSPEGRGSALRVFRRHG
jgi:hypothetical protein